MSILHKKPFFAPAKGTATGPSGKAATSSKAAGGQELHQGEGPVICIGGMNVDRKYMIEGDYIPKTSNPARSEIYTGGVARNIAENLGQLNQPVNLLSIGGFDQDFEWVKIKSEKAINMSAVDQLEGHATGSYTAVLDQDGEMQLALADMAVYDQMDLAWIESKQALLEIARLIIIDLNLPAETVAYLVNFSKDQEIPLFVVPVSSPKMNRLPANLEGLHTIFTNIDESETYFNLDAKDEETVQELAKMWHNVGVGEVILTKGSQATAYSHKDQGVQFFQPPHVKEVVDVTGAGDSFVAGYAYAYLNNYKTLDAIQFAMTNAYHTIQSLESVRPGISEATFISEKEDLFQ